MSRFAEVKFRMSDPVGLPPSRLFTHVLEMTRRERNATDLIKINLLLMCVIRLIKNLVDMDEK
jgi:hypothetical protein